ncbi:MAG: divalent-cation tolerance protein CutA [Desulfatiglandaceae bacterium]|jgi:periplasmic divalent cation tolerance protein
MDIRLVYITVPNVEEARALGRGLVESRLAACVNIINQMHSVYRWEGKIQEKKEMIVLAKTRADLVPELIERIESLHSYECPCIVTLPIMEGFRPFLDWVEKETRADP